MTSNRSASKRETSNLNPRFMSVARAFARDRQVSRGEGKGFGSGALKLKGKIFAMMSSKGQFVVKLPKNRVAELVRGGQGQNFDTGGGRIMKEWVVIKDPDANWNEFAKEAYQFAKRGS
jgi:hypothetical protein